MITDFFADVISISFVAGVVAIAVILLRILFKKSPRWITCMLWAFVGLRLIFPFAPESSFSLIPSLNTSTADTLQKSGELAKIHTGDTVLNSKISGQIASYSQPDKTPEVIDILAIIWISVAAEVLLYGVISYVSMYMRVRTAVPLKKNIYQSENVKSPFVLGFIKPRIYIPFNLSGRTLKYVLAHEEAHIRRKDHILKPFAFLMLSFHWFNPLLWISYILLCRDIEVACDEKVIKNYSINKRKNYAFALLNCKVNRSNITLCPVSFGEVNVSTRIKKTLAYKKPTVWVIAMSVMLSVVAACCLLTNPKKDSMPVKPSEENMPAVSVTEPENNTSPSDTIPATEHAVIETTAENTEAVTLPSTQAVTEIVTQAVTEAEDDYYDGYYYKESYEDVYIREDRFAEYEYREALKPIVENSEFEAAVPSWIENDRAVLVWSYDPVTTVEKQNQDILAGSTSWKNVDSVNSDNRTLPQYSWEQPGAYNPYTGEVNYYP